MEQAVIDSMKDSTYQVPSASQPGYPPLRQQTVE